jgi:hypothetical protein
VPPVMAIVCARAGPASANPISASAACLIAPRPGPTYRD